MLWFALPTLLIAVVTVIAVAPWNAPSVVGYALQVMPYMAAHLFLARGWGFVPSPVIFLAGLAVDVTSNGPLGFWALIYLSGTLLARQLPAGVGLSFFGRLSGLLFIIFALVGIQVGVASVYQLKWVNWQSVMAGTLIAGSITLFIDFLWQAWTPQRDGAGMAHRLAGGSDV